VAEGQGGYLTEPEPENSPEFPLNKGGQGGVNIEQKETENPKAEEKSYPEPEPQLAPEMNEVLQPIKEEKQPEEQSLLF